MHEILLEVVFCCSVPPVPFAMHVWKDPHPTRSSPGVESEEEGIGRGEGPRDSDCVKILEGGGKRS